jgi:TfoX/Sxy family transcriptional regulator of competence genes
MPKWRAAPDEMVRLFESALLSVPEAQTRKVFGYPAAFINGQMFAALHQDNMILRLSEPDREAFLRRKGAGIFEPMPGRPMREYAVVPPSVLKSKPQIKTWLSKAIAYAKSLPPKAPKASKTRSKKAVKSV